MIEIVPATADMADRIRLQDTQRLFGFQLTRDQLAGFIREGPAFAAVDDGILAMAGLVPVWAGRHVAWGLLSDGIGARMTTIHRTILRGLDGLFKVERVEAYVADGHDEGKRWCKMLGFAHEGLMHRFHDGHDYHLFARVRG